MILVILFKALNGGRRVLTGSGGSQLAMGQMEVSALALALDWRARADLQTLLAQLAASGRTSTSEGRAELLRETCVALLRAELSWLYASYLVERGLGPQAAEARFRTASSDARSRFKREVVRVVDDQATRTQNAPELHARAEEGKGVVIVTLLVASRRVLGALSAMPRGDEIKNALRDRSALGAFELVALEVVWSPAAENDRMSTAELEQVYPEMKLIDPSSIAGRIFCAYCSAPFAKELMKCPHCGAPVAT